MSTKFKAYVMMIDKNRKNKIVTISGDVNNTDFFLPGGDLYLGESWKSGAVRIIEFQIGVKVKKNDLIFLHVGVINQINTVTYLLYKWKGLMNIDYRGCLILDNTVELLKSIHYFKEQEDDYFKIIINKYHQYVKEKKKSKLCF